METIRVVLIIGDIYDNIPCLFQPISRAFSGDADILTSEEQISPEYSLTITAIPIKRYINQVKELQNHPRSGSKLNPEQRYSQAVRNVVHGINGPLSDLEEYSPQILVIGQTTFCESAVEEVNKTRKSIFDPLIVRFSLFYGKPKGYTEKTAAQAGYDIDLYKDLECLVAFISDPLFLESVLQENIYSLERAIQSLKFRGNPIFIL